MAVLPLLPLLAGILVLQALFGGDLQRVALAPVAELLPPTELSMVQLGGYLAYAAMGYFHVVICALVLGFFLYRIVRMPPASRRRAYTLLALQSVIALVAVVIIERNQDDLALVWLGYQNTCNLLLRANVEGSVVTSCAGDITKLTLLAWVPSFLGMATVVCAAAWANASAGQDMPQDEPAWRERFAERIKDLQRGFYALSAVLVTGTLGTMLFLTLPAGLAGADKTYNAAVGGFAQGMTAFWGTIYTLSLIVTFVPAAVRLWHEARLHEQGLDAAAEFHDWLREHVTLSTRRQLTNLAAALGPILVGPMGSLLGKLAGLG